MAGLVFIVMGRLGGRAVVAVWQWWLERTAAGWRGCPPAVFWSGVTGQGTQADGHVSGLAGDDPETEAWRVRSVQRRRIAVRAPLGGVVWLVIGPARGLPGIAALTP